MHVATSSIAQLLDYAINTPPDGFNSTASVNTILDIIKKNKSYNLTSINIPSEIKENQFINLSKKTIEESHV